MTYSARYLLWFSPLLVLSSLFMLLYAYASLASRGTWWGIGDVSGASEAVDVVANLSSAFVYAGDQGVRGLGEVVVYPGDGIGVVKLEFRLRDAELLKKYFQYLHVVVEGGGKAYTVLDLSKTSGLVTLDWDDFYGVYCRLGVRAYYEVRPDALFTRVPLIVGVRLVGAGGGPRLPALLLMGYRYVYVPVGGDTSQYSFCEAYNSTHLMCAILRSRTLVDIAGGRYSYTWYDYYGRRVETLTDRLNILGLEQNNSWLPGLLCGRGALVFVYENPDPGKDTVFCLYYDSTRSICVDLERIEGAVRDFLVVWEDSPEVIKTGECPPPGIEVDGDEWIRVTVLSNKTVRIGVFRAKGDFYHRVFIGDRLLYEKDFNVYQHSGFGVFGELDSISGPGGVTTPLPILVELG